MEDSTKYQITGVFIFKFVPLIFQAMCRFFPCKKKNSFSAGEKQNEDKELKALRLVNAGRLPRSWAIEAVPGRSGLKGTQEKGYRWRGAIFFCVDEKVILFSSDEAGPTALWWFDSPG